MAVSEKPNLGLECKLYRNTGTNASPSWSLIPKAINVKVTPTKTEAQIPSRESGWMKYRGALKDFELTWTYRKKQGTDTVFDALQGYYINGTPIQYFVADGAAADSGTQGIKAYCEIMKMEVTQDLEAGEEVAFSARPTYYEESSAVVDPTWYEVP
jgi:hypothetical protein